jgi:integrase
VLWVKARQRAISKGPPIYYLEGYVRMPSGKNLRVRKSLGIVAENTRSAKGLVLADRLRALYEAQVIADPEKFVRGMGIEVTGLGRRWEDVLEEYMVAKKYDGQQARRMMASFRGRTIGDITAKEVDAAVTGMTKVGALPSTRLRLLAEFSAVLNWAHRQGYCPKVWLDKPTVREGRVRWLDDRELGEFLDRLEPRDRDFAAFLAFTGARLMEAWELDWQDVGEKGVILRTQKGGVGERARLVPLHPVVRELLMRRPGREGRVWSDYSGTADMSRRFSITAKEIGKDDVTAHTMRHTFISRLVSKGVPLAEVSKLAGHSKLEMTMRYTHLAESQMQSSIDKL